jgi:hypothetical protein
MAFVMRDRPRGVCVSFVLVFWFTLFVSSPLSSIFWAGLCAASC